MPQAFPVIFNNMVWPKFTNMINHEYYEVGAWATQRMKHFLFGMTAKKKYRSTCRPWVWQSFNPLALPLEALHRIRKCLDDAGDGSMVWTFLGKRVCVAAWKKLHALGNLDMLSNAFRFSTRPPNIFFNVLFYLFRNKRFMANQGSGRFNRLLQAARGWFNSSIF